MSRGVSVHVGVNEVDSSVFNTQALPPLKGCKNDAIKMCEMARARGFTGPPPFLDDGAKFDVVVDAMLDAALKEGERLEAGDIFLFTFSGHGTQRPDKNHDEPDDQDETLVLHDRVLIDDFLRNNIWSQFRPGVRIVGVADCCHAGTSLFASLTGPAPGDGGPPQFPGLGDMMMAGVGSSAPGGRPTPGRRSKPGRDARLRLTLGHAGRRAVGGGPATDGGDAWAPGTVFRELPEEVRKDHFENRLPDFYKKLKEKLLFGEEVLFDADLRKKLKEGLLTGERAKLKADLITLAACLDVEKTPDEPSNGPFTRALLDLLADDSPPANYDVLRDRIQTKLRDRQLPQTPVIIPRGNAESLPAFRSQMPFKI
jgi:hypothetical protein